MRTGIFMLMVMLVALCACDTLTGEKAITNQRAERPLIPGF
jgi:hypothetical protein